MWRSLSSQAAVFVCFKSLSFWASLFILNSILLLEKKKKKKKTLERLHNAGCLIKLLFSRCPWKWFHGMKNCIFPRKYGERQLRRFKARLITFKDLRIQEATLVRSDAYFFCWMKTFHLEMHNISGHHINICRYMFIFKVIIIAPIRNFGTYLKANK